MFAADAFAQVEPPVEGPDDIAVKVSNVGGEGNDLLIGGDGADVLRGGAGTIRCWATAELMSYWAKMATIC